jgi:hypothetical protein
MSDAMREEWLEGVVLQIAQNVASEIQSAPAEVSHFASSAATARLIAQRVGEKFSSSALASSDGLPKR